MRKLRKLSVESCTSYQKSLDVSQHFFSTLHAAARLHGIGPGLRCIMRLGYQLGSWIRLLCVGWFCVVAPIYLLAGTLWV